MEFEVDSNGHALFNDINISAWLKLVCSVYLIRHKWVYSGEYFHKSFLPPPLPETCKQMLGWIGLNNLEYVASDKEWCQFVRSLTFHAGTVTKDHEKNMLPSWEALTLHCKRALYVLKLVFSTPYPSCPLCPLDVI